jgi:class 3 adenylate cyclase
VKAAIFGWHMKREKVISASRGQTHGMPAAMDRRLAAILAADIAGYSRLMGEDEEKTVRALQELQAAAFPMIGEHGGRIINTAGDSVLAEFASVVGGPQR